MSTNPPGPASQDAGAAPPDAPALPGDVATVQRTWLTEDWLATIVGLALLLLLIFGILPKQVFL